MAAKSCEKNVQSEKNRFISNVRKKCINEKQKELSISWKIAKGWKKKYERSDELKVEMAKRLEAELPSFEDEAIMRGRYQKYLEDYARSTELQAKRERIEAEKKS